MDKYFSDCEKPSLPRNKEEIPNSVWKGIASLIETGIDNGSFGLYFPDVCEDGGAITGTNRRNFKNVLQAEIPDMPYPFRSYNVPDKYTILDFIQFCYEHIADPTQEEHDSYRRHYHLTFNQKRGRDNYRDKINRIFSRNMIAFELEESGNIFRLTNTVLQEAIYNYNKSSGDNKLDNLLQKAVEKYLNPKQEVRVESLEKLWDAWERIKTIGIGKDKKEKTKIILDRAALEQNFRKLLETEAKELTNIGNKFTIRHTETNQIEIKDYNHVDYLFLRLFSMINLLLVSLKD